MLARVLSDWLDDSRPLERVFLPLFGLEDVAKLVESLDVEELCLPGLGQRLYEHAGGHPLFTLETLKAALLQGHDPVVDPLPMPAAVQASLSRRLSELPGRALPLLHVAAVAGPDLTVERAARMLGRSALDLAGPWADLESANVLRGQRFACNIVRMSALQLLPEPVQHVLHAGLARVLAGEAEVTPGRLAERWEAGERWAEAATCWHAAATAARHAGQRAEHRALLARAEACRRRAGISIVEFDLTDDPVITIRSRQGGSAAKQDFPRAETLPETRTAG
jgi:hypothetical protein